MWYEINVSKRGRHYFATSDRSITTVSELKEIYIDLIKRFPEVYFKFIVSECSKVSKTIDMEKL